MPTTAPRPAPPKLPREARPKQEATPSIPGTATPATEPADEQRAHRGDWIAFLVLVFGFALMALMSLYDATTGLFR
jgi:hypothetical protein